MIFTTLIDTPTLAAHLGDPGFAIVDCSFRLDEVEWGIGEYRVRHIPGAVYAHLDSDLSGPKTGSNGRHPLPDPATFARTLGRLGIDAGIQVAAYDQDTGMYASRLWWMLRWMGHDAVAVVDGGLARWLAERRPIREGDEQRTPRLFQPAFRPALVVSAAEVAALSTRTGIRLLDARAPERFRGDVEPIDRKAGHIPGASNRFYMRNVKDDGAFRSKEELRADIERSLGGVSPDQVVSYCGSGVTSCHNLLAMEHVGLRGGRLYAGSWSEWTSDPARPTDPPG